MLPCSKRERSCCAGSSFVLVLMRRADWMEHSLLELERVDLKRESIHVNKVLLDSADSKSLIPLSFLADAPAACDAASEPVQVASLVLFRRRCMEILDRW